MTRKTNRQLQVRTTLKGTNLIEFEALIEHLGLTPSSVLKLAVRRLAGTELNQHKNAFPVDSEKAA
jgi:antitoxin component of RelBE/YafQ-DinJ toxin-antitoxin module